MVLGREIASCTHARMYNAVRDCISSPRHRECLPTSYSVVGSCADMTRNLGHYYSVVVAVVVWWHCSAFLTLASWLHSSVSSRHTSTQEPKSKERGQRACIRFAVVNHKPCQPPCSVVVDTGCVQLVRKKGRFLMRGRRLGQITKLGRLGCQAAHSHPSRCSPALTQSNSV